MISNKIVSIYMISYQVYTSQIIIIIIILTMTIEEALACFKSAYDLCKQIGVPQSNFTRWKKQNFIPVAQQIKVIRVTGKDLPIDIDKQAMGERLKNEISIH